eukprot:863536-Prorocentrum_minimum.AAC.1
MAGMAEGSPMQAQAAQAQDMAAGSPMAVQAQAFAGAPKSAPMSNSPMSNSTMGTDFQAAQANVSAQFGMLGSADGSGEAAAEN